MVLFLDSEMTARQDVSSFVRFLSYVYVNVWIPIRLNYLRLKIALRPAFRVGIEALSLMNMVWSMVPISILMIFGEVVSELSKEWLRLVCLGYEKAIGVPPGSIYEKSMTISAFVGSDCEVTNGEEQPVIVSEGTYQPSETDQAVQSADQSGEAVIETTNGPSIEGERESDREAEPESERKNMAISEDSNDNSNAGPDDDSHTEPTSAIADDGIRIE